MLNAKERCWRVDQDTIAAISTALGESGIAIVRISGDQAIPIVDRLFRPRRSRESLSVAPSFSMRLGEIVDHQTGKVIDEAIVSVMRKPRTYTREDVVEINCHGGLAAVRRVLEAVLANGARLAEPGEFTKRAFLNGRLDLSQAEAVIDIIRAKADGSLRLAMENLAGGLSATVRELRKILIGISASIEAAIDFPDEEIPGLEPEEVLSQLGEVSARLDRLIESAEIGKVYREGVGTVIVGKPNVGKSSLLNALLRESRAIVTDVPGTTRDAIEELVNLEGIPFRLVDTAGIRETSDAVEKLGVERTRQFLERADLVILVVDAHQGLSREDREIIKELLVKKTLVVINKTDLPESEDIAKLTDLLPGRRFVRMSLVQGWGLSELEAAMVDAVAGGRISPGEGVLVSNLRHKEALKRARRSVQEARNTMVQGLPEDLLTVDLKAALDALGEITGETVDDEVVNQIFSQFCIGK